MAAATKTNGGKPDATPVEEVKWAAPSTLFLTIALTFVALCAATLALPHKPYIRFQQLAKTIQFHSQWIYERIEFDPTPIDVAIVGNSRLEAGVSAPRLQTALQRLTGQPIHVANLSMPQEGRNMHYAIVKRLLDKRPEVKLIILSVVEQMPRDGHPAFRDLADMPDVLGAPVLLNRNYAYDVSVLPFRQLSLFVQSWLPALFHDKAALDFKAYGGTDRDTTESFRLPDGHLVDRDHIPDKDELTKTAHRRIAEITKPLLPSWLADYEFVIDRSYTRRIVNMARARGVAIIFVQMPIYDDHRDGANNDFYRALGPVLRPDLVAGDYRFYSDYAHLNVHGSRRVTAWLADQIVQRPVEWRTKN